MKIKQSTRFKRDLKLARKRGLDMDLLGSMVELLAQGVTLPLKYRDHPLTGNYTGFRECHITPDWLLIYRVENEEVVLYLFRTGTHSDLF
ncbi:MAG: type II toxin-antitoxin system YafQ family toxin [Defluviitaleaceae bacterium]|nr:type II toxin-antitoxin system YafQ family toxin [Defluviitaleaceae bacterium]